MRQGEGGGVQITKFICFLKKTGMEPLEKQLDPSGPIASREAIGPLGSNCFSREVRAALREIR